jgi:uncharacterized membrane protein
MDITPNSESLSQNQAHQHTQTDKLLDLARLRFPKFKHEHPPIKNINEVAEERLTMGQKIADNVASTVGSWRFIIIQSILLLIWLIINSIVWYFRFDPYPFILLNLALSFQAAYSAPFVMMSQNRQAEKDRLTAQSDYLMDTKGEEEIRHIMEHLDHQDDLILSIVKRLEDQHQVMLARLSELDPEMAQKIVSEGQQIAIEQEVQQNSGE